MNTHSTGLDDCRFPDLEAGVDQASTAANHPRSGESREIIRTYALALLAALAFRESLNKVDDTETHEISTGTPALPETPARPAAADDCEITVRPEHENRVEEGTPAPHVVDFSKTITELASLTNGDVAPLDHREVESLAKSLKTSISLGINGDESDLLERKKQFGSNTYPHRKGRTFLKCVWEAGRTNATLIILMTIAAASLATGLMTKGINEGWYEACCVITRLISVFAVDSQVAYYRESHEFQKTHEKMRTMDVKVTRGGTPMAVPICDIVVGDMVHLGRSTQVPADGVLVTSHDRSHPTDPTRPIVRFGSFVAYESGTMLVLGVGKNTEWGSLMGSKDQPKRNPLRVRMNLFATLMSVIGLIIAVGVGDVLLYNYVSSNGGKCSMNTYLVIAGYVVTQVLITVPVGLSFALSSSHLLAARELALHNVRVRTPSACGTAAFTNSLVCEAGLSSDMGPCQPGAKEVVKRFREAGIEVRMVTAENLEAAQATALECGIIRNAADDELIEGKEFSAKPETERQEIAARIKVMAGCSPKDQLLLVQALKQKGERVAFCGRDAASLREADVGLALGNQATEIAKESSDIIILDGEITTIAKVFRRGRDIDGNFLKFLQRQLCLNVVGFLMNAFSLIYYGHIAVNAVEFMWLNLIIYALGPLSSTMEPLGDESDDLMHRVPIMDPRKCIEWRRVLIQVTYQMAALLAVNFQGISFLKPKHYTRDHTTKVKNTMIFNTFAVSQILIEFEARKKGVLCETRKWLLSNYRFIIVGALVLGFQFIIIEFGEKPFSTVRLNFEQWKFSATFGLIELLFLGIFIIKKLAHSNE